MTPLTHFWVEKPLGVFADVAKSWDEAVDKARAIGPGAVATERKHPTPATNMGEPIVREYGVR